MLPELEQVIEALEDNTITPQETTSIIEGMIASAITGIVLTTMFAVVIKNVTKSGIERDALDIIREVV